MKIAVNFRRVDPSRGGAETYVADLCRRLVADGHDVTLFAESWADGALPPGLGTVRVAAPGPTRLARLWSFAKNSERALERADADCSVGLINTWAHDVIIPQGGVHPASLESNAQRFATTLGREAYRLGKRANPKDWAYRAIERRQYDPARGAIVVAVSRFVAGHLSKSYGVPPERIRVIPNAIDADRLAVPDPARTRSEFRTRLGVDEGCTLALFLAHNFRLKGLDPLLEALRLRRERSPGGRPVRLVVCGGGRVGPYRRAAGRLGLADDVTFLGFVDEVRPCFHGCDFFVQPTYYDPCSLVVFEALACGLPVITTECNGASELITPGRDGFVIPRPRDIGALADAIDRLADVETSRAMSAAARATGRFQSFERHVGQLLAVFEEVAAAKGSRSSTGAFAA